MPRYYFNTRIGDELVSDVDESSSDVNVLCETYGLRREELGRLTGFSLRALAGWAAGELPSLPAKRRLHEIRQTISVDVREQSGRYSAVIKIGDCTRSGSVPTIAR